MNERLKELAMRAGLHIANNSEGRALVFGNQAHVHVLFDELERFAELVRRDEREACAIALETGVDFNGIEAEPLLFKLCLDVVGGCATVIRARGNK